MGEQNYYEFENRYPSDFKFKKSLLFLILHLLSSFNSFKFF
jgi:hypothetical protein